MNRNKKDKGWKEKRREGVVLQSMLYAGRQEEITPKLQSM